MTKLKKIGVNKYIFKDELGNFEFHDTIILVPMNSRVTPESFNQEQDEYSISSIEIERMYKEALLR